MTNYDIIWYQHTLWILLYLLWTILSWSYCIREPVLQTSENLTNECLSGGARIGVRFTGDSSDRIKLLSDSEPFIGIDSWLRMSYVRNRKIMSQTSLTMRFREFHLGINDLNDVKKKLALQLWEVTAQLPALWRSKCKYGLEVPGVQCLTSTV